MKLNKIIKIIALSLLGALLIASGVLWFVNKELLLEIIETIKDFLNQPLPIIGITLGAVLLFVWKLIITSNYGKKQLALYDEKQKDLEKAHEKFVNDANNELNKAKQENELLKTFIIHICELSTNQKIKNYGKELVDYGKETNDLDTEEK